MVLFNRDSLSPTSRQGVQKLLHAWMQYPQLACVRRTTGRGPGYAQSLSEWTVVSHQPDPCSHLLQGQVCVLFVSSNTSLFVGETTLGAAQENATLVTSVLTHGSSAQPALSACHVACVMKLEQTVVVPAKTVQRCGCHPLMMHSAAVARCSICLISSWLVMCNE